MRESTSLGSAWSLDLYISNRPTPGALGLDEYKFWGASMGGS
jgi:hypothetical protein